MIKYEAPKINITYFEDIVKTGPATRQNSDLSNLMCNTAANNLNIAADGPLGSVATRTVRVQTILQFN